MRRAAVVAAALLLGACSGPSVRPQVLTPPPSAPRAAFAIERADVQSREVGAAAWKRNEEYGQVLVHALQAALRARGKAEAGPPADTIRPRVYLGYGDAPVKAVGSKRAKAHVEVRLQLLDAHTGAILYSTHTQSAIQVAPFAKLGWGPDGDQIIRDVLEKAAQDFVSRL